MKLLVVEDDVRMAGLLHRGLVQERWAVDIARDGVDARHAISSTPYDAVVCDVGCRS
jgi:two-component system OmpR family response regulator